MLNYGFCLPQNRADVVVVPDPVRRPSRLDSAAPCVPITSVSPQAPCVGISSGPVSPQAPSTLSAHGSSLPLGTREQPPSRHTGAASRLVVRSCRPARHTEAARSRVAALLHLSSCVYVAAFLQLLVLQTNCRRFYSVSGPCISSSLRFVGCVFALLFIGVRKSMARSGHPVLTRSGCLGPETRIGPGMPAWRVSASDMFVTRTFL